LRVSKADLSRRLHTPHFVRRNVGVVFSGAGRPSACLSGINSRRFISNILRQPIATLRASTRHFPAASKIARSLAQLQRDVTTAVLSSCRFFDVIENGQSGRGCACTITVRGYCQR
jgi:hypothetical protein